MDRSDWFRDTDFFAGLLAGDAAQARAAVREMEVLCDPRVGPIEVADLPLMVDDARGYWGELRTSYVSLRTLDCPRRKVTEGLFAGALKGRVFSIPVCTVADVATRMVRVYYTLWPLTGTHVVRPPVCRAEADLALSDVVAEYQEALAKGDLEAILACFEREACAREPSGAPYIHCGAEGLRRFYAAVFAGGGLRLDHCTVTDDGRACAIEYAARQWGQTRLPAQAGVAIYERGSSGRLRSARIYDDVDPPAAVITALP